MTIELYELNTHTPLEAIKGITAVTLKTITTEIQILNYRDAEGKLRGREIDSSRLGVYITE